ncbi:MAG: hypothetical protein H7250_01140 [Flavobacterium sp.]|nr:hypothetical protein [Flavobacterium sp.]
MSTNTSKNDDQEIDLSQISKKIGGFFDQMATSVFKGILFLKKNIVTFILLFVVGVGIGYFLDYTSKSYNHQIIISPNFGSTDYLYSKVNLISSKIKQNDTLFLKSIGIENPKNITNISISPINDIYNFVNDKSNSVGNAQNSQNFELLKLLAEDGDINKVIKDSLTSKNFSQHKLNIATKGFVTKKNTLDPIMVYLNNNVYYSEYKKTYLNNSLIKIKEDQVVIDQINVLLNEFSSNTNSQKNDKLIYYNENTQLNEIIKTKTDLVSEIGYLKTQMIGLNKIIIDKSSVINIKNTKGIGNKMKLILPILLIFGYIGWKIFIAFYKKQEALNNNI